jgi:peptide/nickel transport system substrate-binding protein
MKYLKLIAIIATCLLVTSIFTVIPAFSAQPPIDESTYYVGTIGQPARLDPGRAYDTASGELIQNVYQPLIWFADRPYLNSFTQGDYNATPSDHANLVYPSGYTPVIATALPIITNTTNTNQIWNFTINTNAMFQNWTGPNGVVDGMPPRNVTTDDVVYSFQVQMVMDSPYAPVWMLETAAFGFTSFAALYGYADGGGGTGPYGAGYNAGADENNVAALIQQWCYKDPDHPTTNVIFNWTAPFPISAMAQIMSQTWGSIVNKEFYVDHGNWDGLWISGWSANYRWEPDGSGNRTPIDRYYQTLANGTQASLYTTGTPNVGTDIPDMCGTGPYKYEFNDWNQITETWRLDWDINFWQGWAAAGNGGGNFIHTIIERGIDTWPTRKMLFLDGEFDVAVVPRANMFDLLTSFYQPLPGLSLITNITELTNEEVFFNFNVSSASSYQSYVGTNTTADPYFFANQDIRLAFAWALNYTQVISQAWFGEAVQQNSWWVDGLVPQSSKNTALVFRNENLTEMQNYLQAAGVMDGQNVWTAGFSTTMIYNSGNDQRQIELQSIANAFTTLGGRFKINVVGIDWPIFLDDMNTMQMPVFCLGWLADYADPSDWASPYQQSSGSFLYTQGPPFPADQATVDAQIIAAAPETNPALRDSEYQTLQTEYYNDVPSIPVIQPIGRGFARDWVHNRWINDLLPGIYAYYLYKSGAAPVTGIDLDVQDPITPVTTYSTVFVSMGEMKIPFGGGVLASMTFNVTVKRKDVQGLVPTIISLVRDNLTALTDYRHRQSSASTGYDMTGAAANANPPGFNVPWPNGGWVYIEGGTGGSGTQYTLLGAQSPVDPTQIIVGTSGGNSVTVTLTWYEDGVTSTLPANATWSIGAIAGIPSTAGGSYYLSNTTDNSVTLSPSIYNCTALTETQEISHSSTTYEKYILLVGDINGDGRVDILDAIALSNAFLSTPGGAHWNPACDINNDGTVNILDAILLANHFNNVMSFL